MTKFNWETEAGGWKGTFFGFFRVFLGFLGFLDYDTGGAKNGQKLCFGGVGLGGQFVGSGVRGLV